MPSPRVSHRVPLFYFLVSCFAGWIPAACADEIPLGTDVVVQTIDVGSFAESFNGKEQRPANGNPESALWTKNSRPDFKGLTFADSSGPGARHLRIGFKTAVGVGSVLVRGGGALSVLRESAPFPGNLDDDANWVPAERLLSGRPTHAEVDREEYAIWTLPPGIQTRALRFTHVAKAADPVYAGWLGGAYILPERLANVAPEAMISASARDESANLINNNSNDKTWLCWDNGKEGNSAIITPAHPEWVILTWKSAVTLRGLNALWAGFGAAEIQYYQGPAERHPREAHEGDWKTIKNYAGLENGYPLPLAPNWLDFGKTIKTRAVRILVTAASTESHSHLHGRIQEGRRVWLGELQALAPLQSADLKTMAALHATDEALHPPIPIPFSLPAAGYVTLVIDDSSGKRVRNLISETPFPAGRNTAWWDGADDLGRDVDAARHGLYHIPEQAVVPGEYRVRGLFHEGIQPHYEFSVYNAGNPPWETSDTSGGWLTNHTPPRSVLFVPGDKAPNGSPLIYIGSPVSEGGAGLAWVGMDGRKAGGRGWVGGNWTGASCLARDAGKNAVPDVYAYVASTWRTESANAEENEKYAELRLTALTAKGDKAVLKHRFLRDMTLDGVPKHDGRFLEQLGGIAVNDGILVASLARVGSLLFIDTRTGQVIGESPVPSPRGLAFDQAGGLVLLTQNSLVRFRLDPAAPSRLSPPTVLVDRGLEDPKDIAFDPAGRIYISDDGASNQVKVFSPEGKAVQTIGHAGPPKIGPYDPLHMNQPRGLTIDNTGNIWVAEYDYEPKRVSVWSPDGKLAHAFYGPAQYGGGGALDPADKKRFYYSGMEFALDWEHGTNQLVSILYRPTPGNLPVSADASDPPQFAIHLNGRQYMTNCFNSNPTNGPAIAMIWLIREGVAAPVSALGRASEWPYLKTDEFRKYAAEHAPAGEALPKDAVFQWSDLNADGVAQPNEISIRGGRGGGVTVMPDLSFVESRINGKATRFPAKSFTASGAPVYDLSGGETISASAQDPTSTGGDQVLAGAGGWSIFTTAPKPFASQGLGGVKEGTAIWSYPSLWPGLHASHESALPDRPGELIGTTRLLGGFVTPGAGEAGPLFGINGNMGPMYLFTVDGLFVTQLFQDSRQGKPWSMPSAPRGMPLGDVTPHDENFFPTINGEPDGNIYVVDGARTSLVKVDGLEKIRRLPETTIQVTAANLSAAQVWRTEAEARRQAERGNGTLKIGIRKNPPQVDGKLDEWNGTDWAIIDRQGTAANFNSDSKPYDITGSVMIAGDRLYAAFRTQDAELLKNSGATTLAPFKTGGALDLMIGTDPKSNAQRTRPVAGDIRLIVTRVKDKTLALVYRPVATGAKDPVPFSSPWRTITMDRVDDISAQVDVAFATAKDARGHTQSATYEFSVPLAAIGLNAVPGSEIKGDIGILRGDGVQTLQRVYWNNKATGITADVPSEAELVPQLWGKWVFQAE